MDIVGRWHLWDGYISEIIKVDATWLEWIKLEHSISGRKEKKGKIYIFVVKRKVEVRSWFYVRDF